VPTVGRHHPALKDLRRLCASRRERDAQGVFVAEGLRVAEQIVSRGLRPSLVVVADDVVPGPVAEAAAQVLVASRSVVDGLGDTVHGQGLLAVFERPGARALPADPWSVVVLDGLADPGNMGTILRGAAALATDALVVTPGTTDPWSPKAVRASAGAVVAVPIVTAEGTEVAPLTAGAGLTLVALAGDGEVPLEELPARPTAFVVGSEAHGVTPELRAAATASVRIPTTGLVESLNAAMAATIVMYAAAGRRSSSLRSP
jgi:RNA methyltransferase, TrmH family